MYQDAWGQGLEYNGISKQGWIYHGAQRQGRRKSWHYYTSRQCHYTMKHEAND